MKKVYVFLVGLFLLSCSHDDTFDLKIQNELVIRDNSFIISDLSYKFGLESVQSRPTRGVVRIETSGRPIMLNGISFNEFTDPFTLSYTKNGAFKLEDSYSSELIISESDAYFNGQYISDDYLDRLDQSEINRIMAFMVLYEELTNKALVREDKRNRTAVNGEECGFAASSIRVTRSYAEYKAQEFAQEFLDEHEDCQAIGQDTSCLFGSNHFCISSIAIVCDGATCE